MKAGYVVLAHHLANPRAMFLNYGLSDAALPAESLREEDAPYASHFDLVRRTLGPVEVRDARVIEVGCGRGGNCYYLSRYRSPRQMLGVDPERANLALAGPARAEGAALLVGCAEQLPLGDGTCDVVLSVEASHCYADMDAFFREAGRVLKPGGTLCFSDIWDLEILGLDWRARQRSIDAAPLRLEAEDDISEQVFLALAQPGGLLSWLPRMVDAVNHHVVEQLVRDTEAVRAHLAAGACRYRCMRLVKP